MSVERNVGGAGDLRHPDAEVKHTQAVLERIPAFVERD
jgi:hypothetical protein